MIKHIKRLLGIVEKPVAPTAPTPYKVETPVIQDAPVAGNFTKEQVQKAVKSAKKPAVKAKTAAKPRKPKAPKA